MNRQRFSQKCLTHDDIDEETVKEMDMVLKTISNAEADVSDAVLEQVRRFLEMISEAWAQSPTLGKLLDIGIVRTLATIYDNLIQADYVRSGVLASILELLFIVEDMSDSAEGKIECGKLFLFRLMAFVTATSNTPSLKLQRAVIETICALVTRSPENQQAVLDQKVACYKLFKVFLPRCGDFQLQASITEIFYRLAKKGPHLLHFIQDRDAKKCIESLIQSKKPDLLLEIRKIVTHLNESLGCLRSVYSFLAEQILINGHEMITSDKWVNIGRAQLSFYISGLPDSDCIDENSIMDVQYEDIMEVKKSSPTLLEILVQKRAGFSSFKALGQERSSSTILRTQMHFNAADLSTIESSILPQIRALSVGTGLEEEKNASNSHSVAKSASNCSKGGAVNLKTCDQTNMSGHPGKKGSLSPVLAGDGRLPDRAQHRGRNEKFRLSDNIHNAPDFVAETPQDVDTLQEAATAKNSNPPGRHTEDCYQQQVARLSSVIEVFNPLRTRQPVPNRQEDRPLQNSNIEPVGAYPNMSSGPPANIQADTNHSRRVAIAATDGNKMCESDRPSKHSHLMTQNLQALPGPQTKSPSDAIVRARVCNSDSETEDETDRSRRVGELRMKKRQDPHPTNVVLLNSPRQASKGNSAQNTFRQVKDADVQPEVQRSGESSGKHPMTPLRGMPGSDSVMTDIREKPVTSRKGTKSCPTKSLRNVSICATGQAKNALNNSSRTIRKRQCKMAITYFDADDDANDRSTEFVVTRQRKSRDTVTDPAIDKIAKRGALTTTKRARRAAAQDSCRALTICPRNDRVPDTHQCGRNASTTSVRRKQNREQNCSKAKFPKLGRKVACTSDSRNDDAEDVFRFTANPVEERQAQKTSLALTGQGRQNSEFAEPYKMKRKQSAGESHKLLNAARQRSCTSNGPRPTSVRPRGQIMKASPPASPAVSPPAVSFQVDDHSSKLQKRDEVTPDQQGPENPEMSAFSRSSDMDKRSRSSEPQTRKTYSKSGRIITKNSRLERWRSSSIRKLELPEMDAASEDESIDRATPSSSPLPKVLEENAAEDGEGSSDIGMIAKLLKRFKQKIKLAEKKNVEDILSNTMQRIQREIRSAEEQIRGEKTEFTDSCNKTCGQLESQLQEQIKRMRALYDRFHQEFAQHLESYDGIGCKIEETGLELNDLAKQQGHDHKGVLAKLKESCKNHLADAEQKILRAGKESSTGMRSLKEALQGTLKDL